MILGFLTLLTALCISGIAAYYSIVGLTAIFAGAFWPIIIMGSVLETGKVMTTLWLHYNWKRAGWNIKAYLISAVCILMLITSMGIYGFLSKSHLDQGVPSGDIQAQVALFDEKIQIENDNIKTARTALAQLDSAVDQVMARSDSVNGAAKSAEIRRSQRKEREGLLHDITVSQKNIETLQEQKAPIASKFRKVEADVGPIRYIAALIYGDKADQNMLESAVRLVIIIIVLVFDPMAIVLILAATTSIDWAREERRKRLAEQKEKQQEQIDVDRLEQVVEQVKEEAEIHSQIIVDGLIEQQNAELAERDARERHLVGEYKELSDQITTLSDFIKVLENQILEISVYANNTEEETAEYVTTIKDLQQDLHLLISEYDVQLQQKEILEERIDQLENEIKSLSTQAPLEPEEVEEAVSTPVPDEPLMSNPDWAKDAIEELTEIIHEDQREAVLEPPLETQVELPQKVIPAPQTMLLPIKQVVKLPSLDNKPAIKVSFGTMFPENPGKGDLFLRVDYKPSRLFKWSDSRWFETSKEVTEEFIYDEQYIKLLVSKITSGEYDPDDLSESEQEQVMAYLKK